MVVVVVAWFGGHQLVMVVAHLGHDELVIVAAQFGHHEFVMVMGLPGLVMTKCGWPSLTIPHF